MQTKKGQSIEDASMRIIEQEIGDHGYDEIQWPIVRRIIHSTADFDFAGNNRIIFSDNAVQSAISALKGGCSIVADVNGIGGLLNKQNLKDWKNELICKISDPDVITDAKKGNTTRSQASMRHSRDAINGGVVVIGNAPTALLEVIKMTREGIARPALVIGMPVGFISAAESKEELLAVDCPYITNRGRKGGSPSASAAVNAIFKLIPRLSS